MIENLSQEDIYGGSIIRNFREIQEEWENNNLRKVAKKSYNARRWQKDKKDDYRTEYQRDIGRILFSNPFRRLRMKSQVFIASGKDQHNRTRLTHSLEVAQIAKSIARPLKLNEDLVEAIALGHDLGHTPFGHAGERALDECLKERGAGTFNHNAQSVWIVRKALDGRTDINGKKYIGFNLTYDVTEGIWKHTDIDNSLDEFNGLNYYNPDDEKGSLEAQIVNISDGIAYIRHDIEDAVREDIIANDDFKDLWNKHLDIKFDEKYWINNFIYDLIENNKNSKEIQFSQKYDKAFDIIKDYIFNNIIMSKKVQESDKKSKEKIKTIYSYCIKNQDYVLKKYGNGNIYTNEKFGIDRTVVNFIQWCGDELANDIYESIK